MLSSFLKNFLIALGFLLVGFGVGMIMAKNFQIEENQYWMVTVASLILGGFFTALGVAKRTKEKERTREQSEPSVPVEEGSAPNEEENY